MKVFIPFSEDVVRRLGLNLGELVPFRQDYDCLRLAGPFGACMTDIVIGEPGRPRQATSIAAGARSR